MKSKHKVKSPMKKMISPLKYLVIAMASVITTPISQADVNGKQIGDLEIYKPAEQGVVTISMMLDTSGSMTACDIPRGVRGEGVSSIKSTTNPSYDMRYCLGKDGVKYYDRITRLKQAIFALMDSPRLDSNKVAIGIGQYPTQSDSANNFIGADGRSGKIVVPARLLTNAQRMEIKTQVAQLRANHGTPTAHAYAEVGAYMLGTNTPASSTYSGFNRSVNSSKSGANYITPLTTKKAECNGQGIYFLTDGEPNSSYDPLRLMRSALTVNSFNVGSPRLPDGSQSGHGTPEVGEFAKALRDPRRNPMGLEIKTAVVGFGPIFDASGAVVSLNYINNKGQETTNKRNYYDCSKILRKDAQNACNWGAKTHPKLPGIGGYGEGGFYSAKSTDDIINSVVQFVDDLNATIPSAPSGTITVPDDPYQAGNQQAVAYLPTIESKVAESFMVWPGNVKKYELKEGSLFGKSNAKLFLNDGGTLNPDAQDLWSDKDYSGRNQSVTSGGFYAQLASPNVSVGTVRSVYVEDTLSATDTKTVLRKIGVTTSGKPFGFNDLKNPVYSEVVKRRLLNFLGFDNLPTGLVKDMTLTKPNNEIKVLGGSVHSAPVAVSYSAKLDTHGRVTDEQGNYVLFGSMEGALHLVDANDHGTGDGGKEKLAVLPLQIIKNQSEALVSGATHGAIGTPKFGVDAPWLVLADHQYDFANKRIMSKKVHAYGGLRMGGEGLYGIDLTNNDDPKMLFSLTNTTAGFSRIGQIWAKPTKAKIKMHDADKGTDVLVFGGGYDMCYEHPEFAVGATTVAGLSTECLIKADTQTSGNAVYIVDAKNGQLIWSASNAANTGSTISSTVVSEMTSSVVAGVTTLDRNNDGFMDHIYFTDLGGQVFRADFKNAGFKNVDGTKANNFSNVRVTQVLKNSNDTPDKIRYTHRFYERPVVSFYRDDNNKLFAVINVISGDRSSPLSTLRDSDGLSDRVYGIFDRDITKADSIFYHPTFVPTVRELTDSNFTRLPFTSKTAGLADVKSRHGWFYPLNRFDGYNRVLFTKGVGKSEVINSILYTTVYNPDMTYGTNSPCSAKIAGGSERQLYCMPYGICMDNTSVTGTGGFVRAGQGIQELTLGPRSKNNTGQRLLIGTRTLTDRINDRFKYGRDANKDQSPVYDAQIIGNRNPYITQDGGDGSAAEFLFNERFTLKPVSWHEITP